MADIQSIQPITHLKTRPHCCPSRSCLDIVHEAPPCQEELVTSSKPTVLVWGHCWEDFQQYRPQAAGPRSLYWRLLESRRPNFLKMPFPILPPASDLLEVRLALSRSAELGRAASCSPLAETVAEPLAELLAMRRHLCLIMPPANQLSHQKYQGCDPTCIILRISG